MGTPIKNVSAVFHIKGLWIVGSFEDHQSAADPAKTAAA
jgi:hypothetical protein